MKANGVEVVTVEDLSTLIEAAPLSTGGKLELDVVRGGVQKLRLVVYVDDRRRVEDEKKQRYLHVWGSQGAKERPSLHVPVYTCSRRMW